MSTKKLGLRLFKEQCNWTIWYAAIMFFIFIAVLIYQVYVEAIEFVDFSVFSNGSSSIFMLVIGILSTYSFFDYYAKRGVTRKNFFKSTIYVAGLLSLFIAMLIFIMNGLLSFIVDNAGWNIIWTEEVAPTGFLSTMEVIVSFIFTHLLYYFIGWMIGLGYYRFGWIIGTLTFVVFALISVNIVGYLWGLSHINFFPQFGVDSLIISIIFSFLFAGILLYVNHRLIKDITVVM